jgi:hypothetical protein
MTILVNTKYTKITQISQQIGLTNIKENNKKPIKTITRKESTDKKEKNRAQKEKQLVIQKYI